MMFALIPLPYRILAAVLIASALIAGGFAAGYRVSRNASDAAALKAATEQARLIDIQRRRADALSAQLAQAESRIVTQAMEVIKNVPSVTTGRVRCLDPAAVRLLQPAHDPAAIPARPSIAEDATAPSASDRDIAYWIAAANQQYDTCAGRLDALIDWHEAPLPSK